MIERDGKIRMTAGCYTRGVDAILRSAETTHEERERTIDELRRIIQAAADAGIVDLVESGDLPEGKC